jgi:hypothetical protein
MFDKMKCITNSAKIFFLMQIYKSLYSHDPSGLKEVPIHFMLCIESSGLKEAADRTLH